MHVACPGRGASGSQRSWTCAPPEPAPVRRSRALARWLAARWWGVRINRRLVRAARHSLLVCSMQHAQPSGPACIAEHIWRQVQALRGGLGTVELARRWMRGRRCQHARTRRRAPLQRAECAAARGGAAGAAGPSVQARAEASRSPNPQASDRHASAPVRAAQRYDTGGAPQRAAGLIPRAEACSSGPPGPPEPPGPPAGAGCAGVRRGAGILILSAERSAPATRRASPCSPSLGGRHGVIPPRAAASPRAASPPPRLRMSLGSPGQRPAALGAGHTWARACDWPAAPGVRKSSWASTWRSWRAGELEAWRPGRLGAHDGGGSRELPAWRAWRAWPPPSPGKLLLAAQRQHASTHQTRAGGHPSSHQPTSLPAASHEPPGAPGVVAASEKFTPPACLAGWSRWSTSRPRTRARALGRCGRSRTKPATRRRSPRPPGPVAAGK